MNLFEGFWLFLFKERVEWGNNMKLIQFCVKDFRCIEDSSWVRVEDITCLVGKNEAGKSALLTALNKLNPGGGESPKFVALEEYPRWKHQAFVDKGSPATVAIETDWELTNSEVGKIEEKLGKKALKSNKVKVTRGYGTEQEWSFEFDEKQILNNFCSKQQEDVATKTKDISQNLDLFRSKVESVLGDSAASVVQAFDKLFPEKTIFSAIANLLDSFLPKFIYFSKYDALEGEVSINDLNQHRDYEKYKVFNALMGLVTTTPQELQNMNKFEELQSKLETVSNGVSRTIKDYWKQNQYLKVRFDFRDANPGDPQPLNQGKIFRTRIEDTRHEFTGSLKQRSTGFMWFFSFVVWFSRLQQTYGNNIIVLLDEPGLTLHGNAQEDLLKYLEEQVLTKCPVLYSTHSPFMVDGSNLQKVRAVEDKSTDSKIIGTKVSDDILTVNQETAFPLQAVMGFDIAQTLFVGPNNLLVEGPSDILYFTIASQLLQSSGRQGLSSKWILVPTGGADKMATFVSLFKGNKLRTVVFLDTTKKKQRIDDLIKLKIMEKQRIFSPGQFLGKSEADIEDLFEEKGYLEVISAVYHSELKEKKIVTSDLNQGSKILKRIEAYFEKNSLGGFSHYRPAHEVICNPDLQTKLFTQSVLENFEKIFKQVNGFIS